jgi:AcrB/AcrD/AcrF family
VTSTARRTRRAELDEHVQGMESAEVDVRLTMKERSREAVLEELREKVSLLPGSNVTIGQPISHRIDHMLSGTRANIAVKIFGDDLQVLRQLATLVQAEMAQVSGVVDLSTEAQADIPTLKVKVDSGAAARHDLETGAVAEALQTARVGQTVGQSWGRSHFRSWSDTRTMNRRTSRRWAERRFRLLTVARSHCLQSPPFNAIGVQISSCARTSSDASWCRAMSVAAISVASSTKSRAA